jgi:hypothetical protein
VEPNWKPLEGKLGASRCVGGSWQVEPAKIEKSLERMGMSLNSGYDAGFRTRKKRALQEEGITLVTLEIEPQDHTID